MLGGTDVGQSTQSTSPLAKLLPRNSPDELKQFFVLSIATMNLHRIRDWAETAIFNCDFYLLRSELVTGGRLRVESGSQLQEELKRGGNKLTDSEMLTEGN